VRVIDLSSDAAKAGLAGGAGVATLGAWLLEAATAGKGKFAADVLATLDGLPIGMKALRSAGIGKTVSASQAQLHISYRSRDERPEASGPVARTPTPSTMQYLAAQRILCMELGHASPQQLPT
jgi:hypothetical protein